MRSYSYTANAFFFTTALWVLLIRVFTELPRSITAVGWANMPDNDYNRIVSGLFILMMMVGIVFLRRLQVRFALQQVLMFGAAVLFFYTVLAVYTFGQLGMSYTGIGVVIMRYLMEILVAVFFWNFVRSARDLGKIRSIFFMPALLIIFLISYLQIATSSFEDVQGVERLIGPFGNPNVLAAFMHFFIVATIVLYINEKGIKFWILLVAQYILLFYTGSMTMILSHLVFLFFVGVANRWYKSKLFYYAAVVIIPSVIAVIIAQADAILARLAVLFNTETFELHSGSSIVWRMDAWASYLSLLDTPLKWLFGLGIGTQRAVFLTGYPGSLTHIFEAPGTHNDYLGVLVDFGLFGLLLFFIGIRALLRYLKSLERINPTIRYLRYFLFSLLFAMLSENILDQLSMSLSILVLVSFCKTVYLQKHEPGLA
ncbi:O-antigen ligase family protein [Fulvivirgaceae bacterium PWU5]|uniref:O-antigen ligase family protein n=1 Tax=Dawidia cretensis TaxID=2782350 RepID=A0AAP2E582_9BACT|nr:O-antigen ligase family protein [Dawidia cretensis]MBT1712202.1 O-antigen ligase family protein [Dawidia cretensis]